MINAMKNFWIPILTIIFIAEPLLPFFYFTSASSNSLEGNLTKIQTNPCLVNNGGCEHNCTERKTENGTCYAECVCGPGFHLGTDQLTCNEGQSNLTSVEYWLKEIGLDSAKLLLFLTSIFLGGYMFVFIVTKLCFRKKDQKNYTLLEDESS